MYNIDMSDTDSITVKLVEITILIEQVLLGLALIQFITLVLVLIGTLWWVLMQPIHDHANHANYDLKI